MGTFFVEAPLAARDRPERREPVKLLMDSGSTYTWVAAALLRTLSVVPTERRRVVTIEGQVGERDTAEVLITFEGRTLHTVCLFGDAGDLDVLGAYTLEGFGSSRPSSTARRRRSRRARGTSAGGRIGLA